MLWRFIARPAKYIHHRFPRLTTDESVRINASVIGLNPLAGSNISVSFPVIVFFCGFEKPAILGSAAPNAGTMRPFNISRLLTELDAIEDIVQIINVFSNSSERGSSLIPFLPAIIASPPALRIRPNRTVTATQAVVASIAGPP